MSGEFDFHIRDQTMKDEEERFEEKWNRKVDKGRYKAGRAGDHILAPFECEICVFIKLKKRYPLKASKEDRLLTETIRRANLDAFWSRERATVGNNVRNVRKLCKMSKEVGLGGPFVSWGPMPEWDYCGHEVAVGMLLASRKESSHSKQYTQYKTLRHLRSCYGNFYKSSSENAMNSLALDSSDIGYRQVTKFPTASLWFSKFMTGLGSRMGEMHKLNLALTTQLITEMLNSIKGDLKDTANRNEKFRLIVFGAYIIYSYVLSLRGSEGLMINLTAIRKGLEDKREHLVVGLRGKVKGESVERDHMFPCVTITSSGINVELWTRLLINAHLSLGRKGGPAMTNLEGNIMETSAFDNLMHEYLIRMFEEGKAFPLKSRSWRT